MGKENFWQTEISYKYEKYPTVQSVLWTNSVIYMWYSGFFLHRQKTNFTFTFGIRSILLVHIFWVSSNYTVLKVKSCIFRAGPGLKCNLLSWTGLGLNNFLFAGICALVQKKRFPSRKDSPTGKIMPKKH